MKPLTFVLASKNAKKLAEMRTILGQQRVQVLSQAQVGIDLEPEETGLTFEENAVIKARAVSMASGLPAIADDSGLMVDALELLKMSSLFPKIKDNELSMKVIRAYDA